MTRILLPRVYAAVLPPTDVDMHRGVAVLAIDTTEDAYLVIDAGGSSEWVPMADVQFVDDILRTAINRGEEAGRLLYPGWVPA